MVVIKYTKLGFGAFIGEQEMFDSWGRVANRAGIEFGEDFSYKLFHPAILGVESEKEYLVVNTSLKEDKVKNKIQELFPSWIEVVDCYECKDFSNLEQFATRDVLLIKVDRLKGIESSVIDVFSSLKNEKKIIDYTVEQEGVKVAVSSKLSNAMCDITGEILKKNGCENDFTITRKKLLLETIDGLKEVDSYLEEKSKESYND